MALEVMAALITQAAAALLELQTLATAAVETALLLMVAQAVQV
jgi:hypothetical protein